MVLSIIVILKYIKCCLKATTSQSTSIDCFVINLTLNIIFLSVRYIKGNEHRFPCSKESELGKGEGLSEKERHIWTSGSLL